MTYLEAASRQLFGIGIGRTNDDPRLTTHADILRCYDLAISLAEQRASERAGGTSRDSSEITRTIRRVQEGSS
jgi:hypothetical protein